MNNSLSILLHGESGVGKSTLASTAPGPRLILDAEGGSRFLRQRKILWDPTTQEVPTADGTWDTCIVFVRDYKTVSTVYQWLNHGGHPFKSLIIDSLTEIQKRLVDKVSGIDQPTQANWGEVLRTLEDYVRKLRDLTFHPTTPLDAVVVICLTHLRDGKYRASVQGKLELNLPSFMDAVGYLYVDTGMGGELVRKLLIAPLNQIDAKDRTAILTEKYGPVVESPNITQFINDINTMEVAQ